MFLLFFVSIILCGGNPFPKSREVELTVNLVPVVLYPTVRYLLRADNLANLTRVML